MKRAWLSVPKHRSARCARENNLMSYTWAAYGLESVVKWTLTPSSTVTHLRMEQPSLQPDRQEAYQGANCGWHGFFTGLEQLGADRLKSARTIQSQARVNDAVSPTNGGQNQS